MKDSIKQLLCGMTLVALAFGTLSAQADDDEVEEMTVTAPYDPLWLYGFGIFVGGNLGGGAPETGPRTHETFCGSEEDQDSPECQEDEDD